MTKEIELTQGYYALIDDDDYNKVCMYKWQYNNGYAATHPIVNGKRQHILMHRLIMGVTDRHTFVDHKNHCRYDNRRENLRICNNQQNQQNQLVKTDENKTSKYKGVRFKNGRFEVAIRANGKKQYLGVYYDEIVAANVYNHYATLYHGEFAKTNDVPFVINIQDIENFISIWHRKRFIAKRKNGGNYHCTYYNKDSKSWSSMIYVNGCELYLGKFENEKDAARKYDEISIQTFGLGNLLNNVDGNYALDNNN